MKILQIILCMMLISFSLTAQKTVELNKQWNVVDYKLFSPNICTNLLSLRNDTIIDSENYLQLFTKNDTSLITDWQATTKFFREDSMHRVYILENNSESLYYDFSLVENDTFRINFAGSECDMVVHQVDSIQMLNGEWRKRIRLIQSIETNPDDPIYGYNDWVQGIGSMTSLTNYPQSCFTDYGFDLLCYYEDNLINYTNPNNSDCFLSPVPDIALSYDIKIYPNPAHDYVIIEAEKQPSSIEIISITGRTIKLSDSINISISDIDPGLYLIRINFEDGFITKKLYIF